MHATLQSSIRFVVAVVLTALLPLPVAAQGDGARTYWHSLAGANAVNFWYINASANANPLDPGKVVLPESDFDANLGLLGVHKELALFGRALRLSALVPVGEMSVDTNTQDPSTGAKSTSRDSARGVGDPGLQFAINLYGTPAMMNLADMVRYEPVFTLDLLATLNFPIGQYDDEETVNLGQHRWYGRIGVPMAYTFAPWIPWAPGQRTTLEVFPALWIFGDNEDFYNPATQDQATLSTDPMLQFETHLTRDITESFWISADLMWLVGADSNLGGPLTDFIEDKSIDRLAIGPTLAFQVNDSLTLSASYSTTVNDSDSGKFSGNEFRLAITYGWHPLVEGMQRLERAHH